MEEFELTWNYSRLFSPIRLRNMKVLFKNLEIKLLHMDIDKTLFRNNVNFKLSGTTEQQAELESYMKEIRKFAS